MSNHKVIYDVRFVRARGEAVEIRRLLDEMENAGNAFQVSEITLESLEIAAEALKLEVEKLKYAHRWHKKEINEESTTTS